MIYRLMDPNPEMLVDWKLVNQSLVSNLLPSNDPADEIIVVCYCHTPPVPHFQVQYVFILTQRVRSVSLYIFGCLHKFLYSLA